MYALMPLLFVLGILGVAFEERLRVNKAATALGLCILLWGVLLVDATGIFGNHPNPVIARLIQGFPNFAALPFHDQVYQFTEFALTQHLGDVSGTLFFVLGSMAIINLVDTHGGFQALSGRLTARNQRKLLWTASGVAFFLSALLGNLATVIVMVAILRKLVPDRDTRLVHACMLVIAANAGGAWSPIGDVTTLLLWTGENLTAGHQVVHVLPSSLAMLLVPLALATFQLPQDAPVARTTPEADGRISRRARDVVLLTALLSLALVPVLQSVLELPAFMGVLLGLVVLWVYTDRLYWHCPEEEMQALRVGGSFSRVDMTTVLFFLGILMAVGALQTAGQLGDLSKLLNAWFPRPETIAFVLGICSSFLDNVALVAGTMGMYPVAHTGAFAANGVFWTFLAYCAVTGGSLLIIGSASGVTVMGLEKIPFSYYLKRFSPLAFLGYLAGAGVFFLVN